MKNLLTAYSLGFGFVIVLAGYHAHGGRLKTACGKAWFWFSTRRVCAWCKPQSRMGGAPWGWKATHGVCERCFLIQAAKNGFPIPEARFLKIDMETLESLTLVPVKRDGKYYVTFITVLRPSAEQFPLSRLLGRGVRK